jgi:hypothetical protein
MLWGAILGPIAVNLMAEGRAMRAAMAVVRATALMMTADTARVSGAFGQWLWHWQRGNKVNIDNKLDNQHGGEGAKIRKIVNLS